MSKKFKKYICLFLVLIIISISTTIVYAAENEPSDIKVSVDGKYLSFTAPPVIIDGATLVPLRAIFEALGAQVSWEEDTKTVTGTKEGVKIVLQIDNKNAFINGSRYELSVPGTLIEDRTMVPARFIAESLGADVDWDGDTSTVFITSAKKVNFTDKNFEKLIRDNIDKPSGDILTSDLRDITVLNGSDREISSIDGIQYLKNIKLIYLNNNKVSDISSLANLKNLESLYLNNNSISDITPLSGLVSLKSLDLSLNRIKDINSIASLTNLNLLGLGENLIFDIKPLKGLKNLKTLHLWRNQFTDISPLASLEGLEELYIYDNSIINIEPLRELKNLTILRLESYDKDQVPSSEMFIRYAQMNDKVMAIINKVIQPDMTDYEKELALHDYIVTHTKYDSENVAANTVPQEAHLPYGVLIKGIAVCDGYAHTMKILLDKVGIESYIVTGKLLGWKEGDAGHAWNIVNINGEYSHLDATWDDPVTAQQEGELKHTYFNISSKQILASHIYNVSKYPVCNKDNQDFNRFLKENNVAEYVGDWIYSLDEKGFIYKTKSDGSITAKISSDRANGISYIDGSIMYINMDDDDKIYKIDTNGKERKKIKDESCNFLKAYNGWVYYSTGKDKLSDKTIEYKLFRMKPNGSDKSTLSNSLIATYFTIENEWIYYRAFDFISNGNINKVRFDGSSVGRVTDDSIPGFNVTYTPVGKSVAFAMGNYEIYANGFVYYINLSDGGKIYKINFDGSKKTLICDDKSSNIEMIGSWIYYKNDGNGKYYRIKTDGLQKQVLI